MISVRGGYAKVVVDELCEILLIKLILPSGRGSTVERRKRKFWRPFAKSANSTGPPTILKPESTFHWVDVRLETGEPGKPTNPNSAGQAAMSGSSLF